MRYFGAIIVLATAFALSAIAAVMSITGMIALFPAHAMVVAIMMGTLETGKIVASGWLKIYWTDRMVPFIHKAYLILATIVLMIITSLGIFGYLSAGHNEQLAPMANVQLQSQALEQQIAQKQGEVNRLQARVALLDHNVSALIDSNHAQSGLRANQTLGAERARLQTQIDADYAQINDLNARLMPFRQQANEVQAKLGPLQNVADFFGWTDSAAAVRLIIGMIMTVFDPLAIVLMISGLITLNNIRRSKIEEAADEVIEAPIKSAPEPEPEPEPETDVIEVDPIEQETFEIVQNLHDRVEELDRVVEEEAEEITPEEANSLDHRERLIQLLQSEPDFLKEVEKVIEELAQERIALGRTSTKYGPDHGVDV